MLQEANNLQLISSAADRSIVIRKMVDSEVILQQIPFFLKLNILTIY